MVVAEGPGRSDSARTLCVDADCRLDCLHPCCCIQVANSNQCCGVCHARQQQAEVAAAVAGAGRLAAALASAGGGGGGGSAQKSWSRDAW